MDMQLMDEQIDRHLDAILQASGSALKHYTMQKPKDDMRVAMREFARAARNAALEEAAKRCESLVAEMGVHSNFACAMKIRALSSPAEQKEGNV